MAKRRHGSADEILLVPFLDILCSLIGVLILIIVVLAISQSHQTTGRTQEEIDLSIEYKKLVKQREEQKKIQAVVDEKLVALKKLQQEVEEKEQKLARLRKLLTSTQDVQKMNENLSQNLIKELDNLLLEIDGHKDQQTKFKAELAKLAAEIAARQPPKDVKPPAVKVQPGGGGLAKDARLYFVEAAAGKIVIYWDQSQRTQVIATPAVLVADTSYEFFLKKVKLDPNSRLIFLIRTDGFGSYTYAAGWAMQTYGFSPNQIGKLPLPGTGSIDLSVFKEALGSMKPAPDAKLLPPETPPKA